MIVYQCYLLGEGRSREDWGTRDLQMSDRIVVAGSDGLCANHSVTATTRTSTPSCPYRRQGQPVRNDTIYATNRKSLNYRRVYYNTK